MADNDPNETPRLPKPRAGDPVTRLNELEDRVEALEAGRGRKASESAAGGGKTGTGSARGRKKR